MDDDNPLFKVNPAIASLFAGAARLKAQGEAREREFEEALSAPLASGMHQRLVRLINDFEASLPADQEIGACLASFGATKVIHVTGLGYENPHIIVVDGIDDEGRAVRLLQHIHQISFLLIPLSPLPGTEPRRIGFR